MAASMRPGHYDGMVLAYPQRDHYEEDSIPAPSRWMRFTPIEIPAGEIVYIGDIEITQQYDFWDRVFDRVEVSFAVRDDYDYFFVDCPPSLGLLTVNGLAAAS